MRRHFRGFARLHMVFGAAAVNSINFELQFLCSSSASDFFSLLAARIVKLEQKVHCNYATVDCRKSILSAPCRSAVGTSMPSLSNYQHVIARRRVSLSARTRARRAQTVHRPRRPSNSDKLFRFQSHAGCARITTSNHMAQARVACVLCCASLLLF